MLLADTLPRVIETSEELERLTREIEPLLDKGDHRTAEEEELCRLVLKLIDDYQRAHTLIPTFRPNELLQALLEESGKRQADLLPVFGSRSRVSDAVNGKRAISQNSGKAARRILPSVSGCFYLKSAIILCFHYSFCPARWRTYCTPCRVRDACKSQLRAH